jgi:hypothetical protein
VRRALFLSSAALANTIVLATHDFRPSFAKAVSTTEFQIPIFVRRRRWWDRLPSRSRSASQDVLEAKEFCKEGVLQAKKEGNK